MSMAECLEILEASPQKRTMRDIAAEARLAHPTASRNLFKLWLNGEVRREKVKNRYVYWVE